jgi:hypothetical protein
VRWEGIGKFINILHRVTKPRLGKQFLVSSNIKTTLEESLHEFSCALVSSNTQYAARDNGRLVTP